MKQITKIILLLALVTITQATEPTEDFLNSSGINVLAGLPDEETIEGPVPEDATIFNVIAGLPDEETTNYDPIQDEATDEGNDDDVETLLPTPSNHHHTHQTEEFNCTIPTGYTITEDSSHTAEEESTMTTEEDETSPAEETTGGEETTVVISPEEETTPEEESSHTTEEESTMTTEEDETSPAEETTGGEETTVVISPEEETTPEEESSHTAEEETNIETEGPIEEESTMTTEEDETSPEEETTGGEETTVVISPEEETTAEEESSHTAEEETTPEEESTPGELIIDLDDCTGVVTKEVDPASVPSDSPIWQLARDGGEYIINKLNLNVDPMTAQIKINRVQITPSKRFVYYRFHVAIEGKLYVYTVRVKTATNDKVVVSYSTGADLKLQSDQDFLGNQGSVFI